MEIFIARDQFGLEMDPAVITLDDEYCYGMEHNDTHFRLGTTYGQCDTKTVRVNYYSNFLIFILTTKRTFS